MRKRISEYTLYRLRYLVGYTLVSLVIAAILVFTAMYIPGGLREAEQAGAVVSGSLDYTNFDPHSVINLPYHILQRAGFAVFGVNELIIKLPSIILGIAAVIGLFLLVREWFRANTALITTMIAATTPLFLFVAQDGTPMIYAVAISTWLLLAGTFVTRQRSPRIVWKMVFFVLFALNLYAPLGTYLNIAIITTMIFHPHIRILARRLSLNRIVIGSAAALIIMTPLIYSIAMHPQLGLELLGIPETIPSIKDNVVQLSKLAFDFMDAGSSPIAQPVVSLGVLIIIFIGLIKFIQIKYTARSYITWFWALTLLPLILINPQYISLVLPLMALMVAMGIGSLISTWYKMFPKNPYARVAGLIPLTFIVVGIVASSVARYAISYHYDPEITQHFDGDVRLLDKAVVAADTYTDNKISVVVPTQKLEFYQLLARYDNRFSATDKASAPSPLIITHDHTDRKSLQLDPVLVLTDRSSQDADRFYLYTSPQQ